MKNYDVKKMYQWPTGAKAILIAVICVAILILGYVVDIKPYQDDIEESVKKEENLKEQLHLMMDRQVTIKGNIAQLPVITGLLQQWQSNFLTKNELPTALNDILKLGQSNNLKIVSFSPSTEVKDGIYYKTPVHMDMTGSYDQIGNFVSQLVNDSKMVSIGTFTISRTVTSTSQVDTQSSLSSDEPLTAKLDIEIYRK